MKSLALLLLALTSLTAPTFAVDKKPDPMHAFVRPFPIVVVPTGASEVHKALAKKLAAAIGIHVVSEMPRNPVCCVWIDISLPTPNPGYFILNQGGGSLVCASNEEQLRAAVDRFIGSIRQDSDAVEVPVGIMSSYPIVPSPVK